MNFKDSVYWKIYADVWGFHKKFADVKGDDSYWEQVVNDAGELYKKYEKRPEGEFAKKLTLDVLDELERIYRRNQNEKK